VRQQLKKVLITSKSFGKASEKAYTILREAGCESIMYNETFDEDEFANKLSDCDALIIGSHKLPESALCRATRLKVISKHGTGLDNIDLGMAQKYSVVVMNVPAINANAVADLTFALLLDTARKVSAASAMVQEGKWEYILGTGVHGKTLSLIGFGEIARNMARRAIGFSMTVLAYDPFVGAIPEEFKGCVKIVSLHRALRNADFLSIHVPLERSTVNLISATELMQMKPESIVINTSRGGIVNEKDLYNALKEGVIAGAALDVLKNEPIRKDEPLLDFVPDRLLITPHIGMYARETIDQVSIVAAQNVVKCI
jgi:D-3-phosphoglycerate dehydrogenase